MEKATKPWTFFLLFFLLGAGTAAAAPRYISDDLVTLLRQGPGDQYKVLKVLKAGTSVELLEETEKYARVRTEDGTEGFVIKQFVTADTPRSFILARLEKENAKLQERIKELETARQTQAAGEGLLAERERELAEIRRQYQELQEKSRGVVELSAERDRLQARNDQLTAEVNALRQGQKEVLHSGAIKWFLAGGGVLLAGWMIGRSSRKKKGYF